ncbi:energy-coupling factor ABC transporter ATP-binding protein [Leucobacter sp. HY1908]
MIELHNAAVTAPTPDGDLAILHPTTITLSERKISVIGANGSGKSTLARLFNGLVLPTAGSVTITPEVSNNASNNTSTTAATPPSSLNTARNGSAVRRSVGFVFTDPTAQMIMPTVIEDIELSLRRLHRKKGERRQAAQAALARFGLETLQDRSVHALSGGQRQLLAIASVLATEPVILVADEPTTLLDLKNARLIGDLLMNIAQQTIVVTHDLELASRAHRTLVIAQGRVAFDGAPREAIAWYRANA